MRLFIFHTKLLSHVFTVFLSHMEKFTFFSEFTKTSLIEKPANLRIVSIGYDCLIFFLKFVECYMWISTFVQSWNTPISKEVNTKSTIEMMRIHTFTITEFAIPKFKKFSAKFSWNCYGWRFGRRLMIPRTISRIIIGSINQ